MRSQNKPMAIVTKKHKINTKKKSENTSHTEENPYNITPLWSFSPACTVLSATEEANTAKLLVSVSWFVSAYSNDSPYRWGILQSMRISIAIKRHFRKPGILSPLWNKVDLVYLACENVEQVSHCFFTLQPRGFPVWSLPIYMTSHII